MDSQTTTMLSAEHNHQEKPSVEKVERDAAMPSLGPTRAIWIVVAYLGNYLLIASALGASLRVIDIARNRELETLSMGTTFAFGSLANLIAAGIAFRMARRSFSSGAGDGFKAKLGLLPAQPREVAIASTAGVGLCVFNLFSVVYFAPPSLPQKLYGLGAAAAMPGWPRYAWTVYVVCVTPLTEEFVFRGVLFAGLLRSTSRAIAACITIAAFTFVHIWGLTHYLPALAMILLLSILAQSARIRSASLLPSIALHLAYNLTCAIVVNF